MRRDNLMDSIENLADSMQGLREKVKRLESDKAELQMTQHFNEHVANLINGNRCRCNDGSCDWCQIYYANDENLALIIESHIEAETQQLRNACQQLINDYQANNEILAGHQVEQLETIIKATT